MAVVVPEHAIYSKNSQKLVKGRHVLRSPTLIWLSRGQHYHQSAHTRQRFTWVQCKVHCPAATTVVCNSKTANKHPRQKITIELKLKKTSVFADYKIVVTKRGLKCGESNPHKQKFSKVQLRFKHQQYSCTSKLAGQ